MNSAQPDRSAKRMQGQLTKAIKNPSEYVKYYMDETNFRRWYVLLRNIVGDDGEYTGGEYLVRIELTENFPTDPPQFYFLTPNGLYGCETKVCVSIGEYHKDDYRAALGVCGFTENLASGMIGWRSMGGGIQILNTTANQKQEHAKQSRAYNQQYYPEILSKINDSYANYSKKWDWNKMEERLKSVLNEEK